MTTQPPAPLPNSDRQMQRIEKMLRAIRNPLHRFLVEAVVTALQTWQAMTDEQKGRYA